MNPEQIVIDEMAFFRHPIYQNYYANINGDVYSYITNKKLKGMIKKTGYVELGLYKDDKCKYYLKHRFVWECFHGEIPRKLEIDHINRNKEDNRLENLRVVSRRSNMFNTCYNTSIHVDILPEDAVEIDEITTQFKKSFEFENYYYSPSTNHVYWKNKHEIIQLATYKNKISIIDIDNNRHNISIDSIRKQLMG